MDIPHAEGITQEQWSAMDAYFNRVPKHFFYFITVSHCIEKFLAINALREIDVVKAEEQEERLFSTLGYPK